MTRKSKKAPEPGEPFIVKVQWPLMTNKAEPTCLVYNKDRSVMFEMPASDWADVLGPENPKGFFSARINEFGACEVDGCFQWEDEPW